MTYTFVIKIVSAPVVMDWGYLENWKSTASIKA